MPVLFQTIKGSLEVANQKVELSTFPVNRIKKKEKLLISLSLSIIKDTFNNICNHN